MVVGVVAMESMSGFSLREVFGSAGGDVILRSQLSYMKLYSDREDNLLRRHADPGTEATDVRPLTKHNLYASDLHCTPTLC
jgi:hypothetical protein